MQSIILIGPMGAGKTSIGIKLAGSLKRIFIDTDQYLENKLQLTSAEIFHIHGEKYFREQEALAITELCAMPNIVLATGGGCILSADSRQLMHSSGIVCYLQVDIPQQMQRLANDQQRPTLPPTHLREEFFAEMAFSRDYLYTEIADIIINTNQNTVAALTQQLLQQLASFKKI